MMPMKNGNINCLGFSLSSLVKMKSNSSSHPQNHHLNHSHLNSSTVCYDACENCDFHSPSLCIMNTSHLQGSSPKLGDFLGGATMATYQFLSLDSSFYSQAQLGGCDIQIPSISEGEFPCLKTWIDHDQALDLTTRGVRNSNGDYVELQSSLSLSMCPASQSSCITASTRQISPTNTTDSVAMETKKRGYEKMAQKQTFHRKSLDTFGQRTSQFRGVTRHRWTGRYEAHLWDNSCKKEGQTRKGRQVYLGGYDMEEKAARAYDLAALKYWGPSTHINFPLENYHQELEEMKNMSRQEYVAHLRRRSSGFSRGASMYRGVTRHHQHGRWQARIGRVAGNKDLYLGTFNTQEEAAEAYDIAAIKFRGINAVTNFDISRYDTEKIIASNTLPTGEIARRNKEREPIAETTIKPPVTAEGSREVCAQVEIIRNDHDWKMPWHNQQQEIVTTDSLDRKTMNSANNQNTCFSVGVHDLISIASSQTVMDELTMAMAYSNPSSLVTSLSSSSEASPDRNGAPIQFAKPNALETKFMISPSRNSNSRANHLPIFASWNDISPVV